MPLSVRCCYISVKLYVCLCTYMTGTEPAPSPRGTMDDHTLHLLSYPKPTSTTCVTRLRTLFRLYVKPVACTASEGLVDKLPPELIAHILIVGVLDAGDLARCAAVCRAFARTVRDPANDVALWKIACDRRWAQMALNPAECYRDELAGLSYKMRYRWAEADGQRRRGAVEDLLRVEVRRPLWATSVPAARLISLALPRSPRRRGTSSSFAVRPTESTTSRTAACTRRAAGSLCTAARRLGTSSARTSWRRRGLRHTCRSTVSPRSRWCAAPTGVGSCGTRCGWPRPSGTVRCRAST